MRKLKKCFAGLWLALILASCTTELTHKPYTSEPPNEAIFSYYLPKQEYGILVEYELMECPGIVPGRVLSNGLAVEDYNRTRLRVRQTVTITESTVADKGNYFHITYSSLDSDLKNSVFKASVYPNGTLKSVGIQLEDRSAAIATAVLTTAVTVAKIAIGVPTAERANLCNPATYQFLQEASALNKLLLDHTVTDKRRAAVVDTLQKVRENLTLKAFQSFVPDSIDDSVVAELSDAQLTRWFVEAYNLIRQIDPNTFDRRTKTHIALELVGAAGKDSPLLSKLGKGIVYREPLPVVIKACAGSCVLEDAEIVGAIATRIAQLGPKQVILLKNGPFDKNNLVLSFSTTGVLDNFEFGSEGSLAQAASALSGVASGIGEIVKSEKAADEADDSAELVAIKSQTEFLNAQSDLIEAKKRLAELQAGNEQ